GAYLRFGGVGTALQVSFNGGASWQAAQAQAQQLTHGANAFSSYWTPVPAGTTQVQFRGQNSALDWMARDISIFAGGPQPNVPPSSTATPTPTVRPATSTAAPATLTPTAVPATSTVAAATPTRTPTSGPATPTAAPATPTRTPTAAVATATRTPTAAPPTPTRAPSTPTRTPTAAPATPTRTPTAAPPQNPSFTTSVSTSPSSLNRGQTVTIAVNVSSATLMSALIDVEVFDPSGNQVLQSVFDNQSFTPGQPRTYQPTLTIPSNAPRGTYFVKVGVFNPGWGIIYHWNDQAATFTVR
ncbi:MAG: hypothetical protein AB7K36_26955, partial [Chloroflexota bacterium]